MVTTTVLWGVLGLGAAALILYVVGVHNAVIRLSRDVDRNFGNLDATLKQRHDEIPKLVDACRAYMAHERTVLERLTELRTGYAEAGSTDEKIRIENELNRQMLRLSHAWEGYPDLKASENFLQVQGRISELETVINDRRELINASVTDHNTLIAQFPALLVARALNFMERPLLRIPEADKQDNLKPFTGA